MPIKKLINSADMSSGNQKSKFILENLHYLLYATGVLEASCQQLKYAPNITRSIIFASLDEIFSNYGQILTICVVDPGN